MSNSAFTVNKDNWRYGRVRGPLRRGIREVLDGPVKGGVRITIAGSHVTNITEDVVVFSLYILDAPPKEKAVSSDYRMLSNVQLGPNEPYPIPSYILLERDTMYLACEQDRVIVYNIQYQEEM